MLGPGGSAPPPSFSKPDVPPGLEGYTSPVGYSIWSVGSKGGPTRVEKNFLELGILMLQLRVVAASPDFHSTSIAAG